GDLPPVEVTVTDGTTPVAGSVNVPVTSDVNDAPSIDVTAQTIIENSAVAGTVAATYTTADEENGSLSIAFAAGSNVDGYYVLANGRVELTASGAAYVNAGGSLPAVSLVVTDNGSPALSGSDSATPSITASNDAPTISVPASINASEDVSQALTGITFSDVDAGSASVSATLSVSAGTLQAAGIAGVSVIGSGTSSLTLVGSISALNAFIAAAGVNYTSASNASGTVNLNIKLDDQGNTGIGGALTADASTQILIAGVADAPNLLVSNASGNEDSAIALSISAALTDASETLSSVTISGIPAGASLSNASGALTFTGGSITLSASQLTGLSITPPAHSDIDFTLNVSVSSTDGSSTATSTQALTVAVNAVADAPSLTLGGTDPVLYPTASGSTANGRGLTLKYFDDVIGAGSGTTERTAANLEGIMAGMTATNSQVIGDLDLYTEGNTSNDQFELNTGDGVSVTGLIFLEAGKTYTFTGYRDDTSQFEIGGTVVDSSNYDSYGNVTWTYTATQSGYFSFELYAANSTGAGAIALDVSVNGATAQPLNSLPLFTDITAVDSSNFQHGAFVSNAGGGYYPATLNNGNEDSLIRLQNINTALVDNDGSESLVVTVGSIPVGAMLTDGTNSFTATAGATSATVTGWNLSNLYIKPPLNFSGSFNLSITATSTENANPSTASSTQAMTVSVTPMADAPLVLAPATLTATTRASTTTYNTLGFPIIAALADNSETLALIISGLPVGVTLSDGVNSFTASASATSTAVTGWTLANLTLSIPSNVADTTATLTITATSTEANGATATTTQSVTLYEDVSTTTRTNQTGTNADDYMSITNTTTRSGGTGNDIMVGDGTNNTLNGDAGNDVLLGNAGNDTLSGGDGADRVEGGDGDDSLSGGTGNDMLLGGAGVDSLSGGDDNDYLDGGAGNDIGTSNAASLLGGAGNDIILGGAGNDGLDGGTGNDTLIGGTGNDYLTGGSGADLFLWQSGNTGNDRVLDFSPNKATPASGDTLDLSALLIGENDGNILNYLSIDTVTSTLQININGQLGSNGADMTIKLENGSGAAADLSSFGTTSSDIINSLVASNVVKIDHS
ncbi:Ca2+-binding RTX toxin-like protein, partial [Pseudomonas fluvialis]